MGIEEIPDLAKTLMWGPNGQGLQKLWNPSESAQRGLSHKARTQTSCPNPWGHESFSRIFGNQHRLCHLWCELSTPIVPQLQPSCYPWA